MTKKSVADIRDDILTYAHNPTMLMRIQQQQLQAFEDEDADGYQLNDPTDPVAFLAEMGIVVGHACIEEQRLLLNKMYPNLAETAGEVYRHMSEQDTIDVFAQPSETTMSLLIGLDDFKTKAVEYNTKGDKHLVIPRDTFIDANGYQFVLQYPIEIRWLSYGAVHALWITDISSPVTDLETDNVEAKIGSLANYGQVIKLDFPMKQYVIDNYTDVITEGDGWSKTYSFDNRYFLTRVWYQPDGGDWVELPTILANDTYNIDTPTAIITPGDGTVKVLIPEIYINTSQVTGNVRVNVYSTFGDISLNLANIATKNFSIELADYGSEIASTLYRPFKSFSLFQPTSSDITSSGRNALEFQEIKTNTIDNAMGARKLPITSKQIDAKAAELGLSISKPVDFVTKRMYTGSISLPQSSIDGLTSAIGSATLPIDITKEILETVETVNVNDNRYTILPETIYKVDDSKLVIDVSLTNSWQNLGAEALAVKGNAERYFYSPYHMVLDLNSSSVDSRVYDLTTPKVASRKFIGTNETTQLDVSTQSYTFEKTTKGYLLTVITSSEDVYKELDDDQTFAQLSFVPTGYEGKYAYINGTLKGALDNERIWEFEIETQLDINRNDDMIINNFYFTGTEPEDVAMPIDGTFNIIYGAMEYYPDGYTADDIDDVLQAPTRDSIGISWEEFNLVFGLALDNMWCKSRPLTTSIEYKYYQEDVPYYYTEDVIATDANGVNRYTENDDGTLSWVYDHKEGDVVYEEDGTTPKIRFSKGEQVFVNGEPVIANERSLAYRVSMSVYDARYRFGNTDEIAKYRETVRTAITNAAYETIPSLEDRLLDETELYYRPETTLYQVQIRKEDGSTGYVDAAMQFRFAFYLTEEARNNSDLIDVIKSSTRTVLADYLSSNITISTSDLAEAIKDELSENIISVIVEKFGEDQDMDIFSVLTDSAHISIGKKLLVTVAGKLNVQDDLIFTFNKHKTTKDT